MPIHGLGGAGGNWPRDGEHDDPSVVPQEQPLYCGCACVPMVLAETGIAAPSQDELYEFAGGIPFSCDTLADVLNELDQFRVWKAAWVDREEHDFNDVIRTLSQRLWVAEMWEPLHSIGNFVVVEHSIARELTILDPFPPGTAYRMTHGNFNEYWTSGAVYLVGTQ